MTIRWEEWEGRTVDGKYLLGNYLGGSEASAVFRTRIANAGAKQDAADAAIKLVCAGGAAAESYLRHWQAASELTHPNLIRILAVGDARLDAIDLVYAVEELAEENLAQILPERALTAEEAGGTLGPVLAALGYVHGKGLVHGRIRPSNILASGDQVKLSSDTLSKAGEIPAAVTAYDAPEVLAEGLSPASDVWSLGITLVEVLTQRVPSWDAARMELSTPGIGKNVPEPFRGIEQCCLQVDPAKRCGLREIANRLEGWKLDDRKVESPKLDGPKLAARAESDRPQSERLPAPVFAATAAFPKKAAKGPYVLVLVAALLVALFFIVRPKPSTAPADSQSSSTQSASTPIAAQQSLRPSSASPSPALPATPTAALEQKLGPNTGQKAGAGGQEILERVTPVVSAGAQRSIRGTIKVRVRVDVDAAGNVTRAKLKEGRGKRYFARASVQAAQGWKFAPAQDATRREWVLSFLFNRMQLDTAAVRTR